MKTGFLILASIVILSLIGIVGVQESEADDVCAGLDSQFYSDNVIIFLGTLISSEKIYYEEPIQTFDELLYYYIQHEFVVDSILKGQIGEKTTLVRSNGIGILENNQYVVIVLKSDKQYSTIGCGSIYPESQLNRLQIMSAMENQTQTKEKIIDSFDIQIVKHILKNKFVTTVVGKIDEKFDSDFALIELNIKTHDGVEIYDSFHRQDVQIDNNGFFGFYIKNNNSDYYVDYVFKIGILDKEEPIIEEISFSIDYTAEPSDISFDMKICKNGFVPILKKIDLSYNCVKSITQEKLIERNWGIWFLMDPILYPNAFKNILEPIPEPPPQPEE